ncbi:MAG: glycosyl hydrolase family 28-related protein [Kiritimatiellae bacterium]|nr:glycosyl hydrolase family 28-related protein [Kiritimatiellia bacterium]
MQTTTIGMRGRQRWRAESLSVAALTLLCAPALGQYYMMPEMVDDGTSFLPSLNETFGVNSTNPAADYPQYQWTAGAQVTNGQLRLASDDMLAVGDLVNWLVGDHKRIGKYPYAANSTVAVDLALEPQAGSSRKLMIHCVGLDPDGWYRVGFMYTGGTGSVCLSVETPEGTTSVDTGFNPPPAGLLDRLEVAGDGAGHFTATLTDTNTGATCSMAFTNLLLRSFSMSLRYAYHGPSQTAWFDNWKVTPGPARVLPSEWRPAFVPSDEEFVGPFTSSWINVKTDYGAMGDGDSDDTAALQNALDDLPDVWGHRAGHAETGKTVLYLPAGTYVITNRLTLRGLYNVALIGEHPTNTIIKWAGPSSDSLTYADGTPLAMLWANGVSCSRIDRITWDGSGSNVIGVACVYSRNALWSGVPYQSTANTYADDVFTNLAVGLRLGMIDEANGFGSGDDSMSIVRCRFHRCARAGIQTYSFNAFINWVWDSVFEDNAIGVESLVGGAHVFRSFFRNSSLADVVQTMPIWQELYGNTSVGSKTFLSVNTPWVASPLLLRNNTILDQRDAEAVWVWNSGPAILLDNRIRSVTGTVGAAATVGCDLVSVGNRYTVDAPLDLRGSARLWKQDDQVVGYNDIGNAMPTLPGTPTNTGRHVVEVATNAGWAEIQAAITDAVSYARSTVHIPAGSHSITQTLTVPANADILLIGDYGGGTMLRWTGTSPAAPLLRLLGPSKATVSDIIVICEEGGGAIYVDNPDQPGARVYSHGGLCQRIRQYGLLVNGCTNVIVEGHGFGAIMVGSLPLNEDSRFVKVVGAGVAATNYTALFGAQPGAVSFPPGISEGLFEVADNGSLLVTAGNYESGKRTAKLSGNGTFTLASTRLVHKPEAAEADIELNGFSGQATFLADYVYWKPTQNMYGPIILVTNETAATKALFLGMSPVDFTDVTFTNVFCRAGAGGTVSLAYSQTGYSPPIPLADQGDALTTNFVNTMLTPLRTHLPTYPQAQKTLDGVTDVRLLNVFVRGNVGVRVGPTEAPSVSMVHPAEGAVIPVGGGMTLEATASDLDGAISRVEFWANGVLLYTDTNGADGWNYVWWNAAAGYYALTTIAYDNEGVATTSGVVNVRMNGKY